MASNGSRGVAGSIPILGLAVAVTIAVLVLAELAGTALARLACLSQKSRLVASMLSAGAGLLLLVALGSALGLARATWMSSFAAPQAEGLLTVSFWQLMLIQVVVFLGAAAASFMVWDEVTSQERALTARIAGQIGSLASAYAALTNPKTNDHGEFAEPQATDEAELEKRSSSIRERATSAAKASSVHAVLRHVERFEFDSRIEAAAHLADAQRHQEIARHLLRSTGRRGAATRSDEAIAASLPESPRDVVDEALKRHDEIIDELIRQVDEVLATVVADLLATLSQQPPPEEP